MTDVQPLWTQSPVAANVRAEMARRGVTANRLPALIGQTQSYWARRMTGRTPFDANDLLSLAGVLGVHAGVFFPAPGDENAPQATPGGRVARSEGFEPPTCWLGVEDDEPEDQDADVLDFFTGRRVP